MISNPGCANPNNIHTTAITDSAVNVTLLDDIAPGNTADIQLDNNIIMQPKVSKTRTIETLQLLLNKIPEPGHEAHQSYNIMNNVLFASILVDAGCEVFLYVTGADIYYNGEVIIRGW